MKKFNKEVTQFILTNCGTFSIPGPYKSALFYCYTPFSFKSHQSKEENYNKAYSAWLRVSFPWSHGPLQNDIKYISNSDKIFARVNKSWNIYLQDKIEQKSFWGKTSQDLIRNPAFKKLMKLTEMQNVLPRNLRLSRANETYITIKDHQDNFPNKITCTLINPSIADIEKIGKTILDRINKSIILSTQRKQWKNSKSVIDWFKNILNKHGYRVILFYLENFYLFISKELFAKAVS